MADNYLEKKMDDYRRGITASTPLRQQSTSTPSVLIIGDDNATVEKCVRRFRDLGWRTAFTDSDTVRGRDLAQQTGAQHHPIVADITSVAKSIELILQRWKKLDLVILTHPDDSLNELLSGLNIFTLFA